VGLGHTLELMEALKRGHFESEKGRHIWEGCPYCSAALKCELFRHMASHV